MMPAIITRKRVGVALLIVALAAAAVIAGYAIVAEWLLKVVVLG